MTVNRVPGSPDYTQSGTNKWIPHIFSKKTIVKFYENTVIPAISNSDYEGDIKNGGDTVIIQTVPTVVVRDYTKSQVLTFQDLEAPSVTLQINRAKYFAFKMNRVDEKQTLINMMDKASADAAEQMKIVIDREYLVNVASDAAAANQGLTAGIKSVDIDLGVTTDPVVITKVNILDILVDCATVGDEQNWPDSDRWIVIPPWMAGMIKKSDLKDASLSGDGTSILRNGKIGSIDRWNIHVSNLYTSITDGSNKCYNVLFGHKSATCFASQLTEMEYFDKIETGFGSLMKGLNLFDYKTLKPESMGVLYATK